MTERDYEEIGEPQRRRPIMGSIGAHPRSGLQGRQPHSVTQGTLNRVWRHVPPESAAPATSCANWPHCRSCISWQTSNTMLSHHYSNTCV